MKKGILLLSMLMLVTLSLQAQTSEHYIEVTGTSEIEIMPDKIHYIIEIREYFKEEFEEWAKPEEYRTKVPLSQIEKDLRKVLKEVGVLDSAVRTQEIGDYWRTSPVSPERTYPPTGSYAFFPLHSYYFFF